MKKLPNLTAFHAARISSILIGLASIVPIWVFAVPVDELVAPQMAMAEPFAKRFFSDFSGICPAWGIF